MSQETAATQDVTQHATPHRSDRGFIVPTIDLTHSGVTVPRFISMHVLGAVFPVTAGAMLYGWRALGAIAFVVATAAIATLIWRSIGIRGGRLRIDSILWMSLLLALMLPAHLTSTSVTLDVGDASRTMTLWPLLPASAIMLVALIWALGGAGAGRIHPPVIVLLLLALVVPTALTPRFALEREHAFIGDLLNAPSPRAHPSNISAPTTSPSSDALDAIETSRLPWIATKPVIDRFDAIRSVPASEPLETYTRGHQPAAEHSRVALESLVRDWLPPLEDMIVAGQPSPIGQASAIAIIIGGLFLLYRGLIDFRVPLIIFLSAFLCLLVLPIPILVTETGAVSKWWALRDPSVGTSLAVTFANYEVMASPLLFVGFFLATSPAVRPMVRRARVIYSVLIGIAAAAAQLYISVSFGPYLALLAISLISPNLDRMFKPRAIV